MNVYGTPPALIPLNEAAAAVSLTPRELAAALGSKLVIVGPNKRGVKPADLDAISPGASGSLNVRRAAAHGGSSHGNGAWG